jgi:eukaryotic-like serine/threonine-protein kinase
MHDVHAYMQGVAVTEEGWRFPPFIVVERGESLNEWQARIRPDPPTTLQVLCHVIQRVKTMHELGMVHRDLKPANVLWRPLQHSWTLIDFGCAAEAGAPLACMS